MVEPRTRLAESFVEEFAGVPLTAECVYFSPQFLDKGIEKEVCDFLLILRGEGILISMKAQEDPDSRSGDKLKQWTIKNADKAAAQAQGALRTIEQQPFWCMHSRRGRVDFQPETINISQVIVITEMISGRVELSEDLPLSIKGVPVTYLSVNDFLNLVTELRAFPDITDYLRQRRILPPADLRTIGDEKPLFEYYLINESSFDGCTGYADALITAAARQSDIEVRNYFQPLKIRFADIVERVSDQLSTRLENYAEGLRPEVIACYDKTEDRKNYLLLQEELCDLRLGERQALGMQFLRLLEKVDKSDKAETMSYGVYFVDSKSDFIYVLMSSKGITRVTIIDRMNVLLRAAMTFYGKTRGMVIADREGKNLEVAMSAPFSPSPGDKQLGERFFAHLKVNSIRLS